MKFLSSKLTSSADFYGQIALMLILVIVLNIIGALLSFRLDATEAQIYSVSSVTKETLRDLDDIVTIKGYFTQEVPGNLVSVREDVRDMVSQYKHYGQGNIRVMFVDPGGDTGLQQEAQSYGIPPVQFNVVQRDKFEVAQGYLGIAVLYGDKTQSIPVVQNISTLEYDITAAIKKVTSGKELTIGIAQKENALLTPDGMRIIGTALSQQYSVAVFDLGAGQLIPDTIQTLIIPGPYGEFTEREQYVIDQYVMSGRSLLVFADGVRVENGLIPEVNTTNLFGLLSSYGVTINRDLVFDRMFNERASFAQGPVQFITQYGFWLKVPKEGFNAENPLVSRLESVSLPWASSLTLEGGAGYTVLVQSSASAELVKDSFNLSPQEAPTTSAVGSYNFVAETRGPLQSFFKEAVPVAAGESEPVIGSTEELPFKASADSARIIVVSDSDMLKDNFIEQFGANGVFIQNLIDGLTLDESLALIRSKAVTERPIKELDDTARVLVKWGNVIGVPIIVVIFAIMRFVWRRKTTRMQEL